MDSDDTFELYQVEEEDLDIYKSLLNLLISKNLITLETRIKQALNQHPPGIEIDHLLPEPNLKSFLDNAASDNLIEFAHFLLKHGADPNKVNPERNRAPLHFAAENGNFEVLNVILQQTYSNVNLNILAGGLTALHYAIKAGSVECVKLLLEMGASPNIPNNRGITALHFAAEKNNRHLVQLILSTSQVLDLDTYKDRKNITARKIIELKFPDIELPESNASADYPFRLRYFLKANDEENFTKLLDELEDLHNIDTGELLRIAVEHNLRDAARKLIEKGAIDTVNLMDLGKVLVTQAQPQILRILLNRNPKLADTLLLPACQELGIPTRPSTSSQKNRLECLKIILNQVDVDVRQEDDKGNNPLHYAARAECQEAVELLLSKGCYIGHLNRFGTPPLAHVAPDKLEEHLDDCLTSINENTEEFEIVFNYENLVPHNTRCIIDNENYLQKQQRPCGETEALLYVANHKHLKHLLKHPVLASFLYLKYLRIRPLLYIHSFLYITFFLLLNYYIWVITNDAPDVETTVEESNTMADSTIETISDNQDSNENGFIKNNWEEHLVLSILLTISVVYLFLRELLQLISSPIYYMSSLENWAKIALVALTFVLLFSAGREISAVATILSTWVLLMFVSQYWQMSTHIEMFKRVTITFIKSLRFYIFLILAFALAFYVLFKENDNFPSPILSLFKTIIMVTGEFDSSDLPFVSFPILSKLIFIFFILLIVIILVNLLTGLAVNDTAEILSDAELVCLISQARMIGYIERICLGSPFIVKSQYCCCINYLTFHRLHLSPMRFMARRVLLFPNYLPQAKLSIKPLKSNEITLYGKTLAKSRWSIENMDSIISRRANDILRDKGTESNDEKILNKLNNLGNRLVIIEKLLQEFRTNIVTS